jgi:CTP:molybdopterin cytidylyltransferase MocA
MGQPKALLRYPRTGRTFITQLITSLREGGLQSIAVVGRPGDHDLLQAMAATPAVDYVPNPSPELGQLSSLLIGIDYAESRGASGALVVPVDMPLIRPDTVSTAVGAFLRSEQPVLRVTHRGQHGHPVIFRAEIFSAIRQADPSQGARAVLRQDPSQVRDLEVDDPGVLRDIDLPAEYRRLLDEDEDPA